MPQQRKDDKAIVLILGLRPFLALYFVTTRLHFCDSRRQSCQYLQ